MRDSRAQIEVKLAGLRRQSNWLATHREDAQAALAAWLDRLSVQGGAEQKELAASTATSTGIHIDTVAEGLALAFDAWTGGVFTKWLKGALGDGSTQAARGFPAASVLLAGSIPSANLLSLILPLALGTPVLARAGRHDSATLAFARKHLAAIDPRLGACLEEADFAHSDDDAFGAFASAECVVATGSDATLAKVASRVPPNSRFVPHGHRISVAVLGPEPSLASAASSLARDVALWDQLGCLSPVALYVASEDGRVPDRVDEALVGALRELAGRLPRGRVEPEAAVAFANERDAAELRAASNPEVRLHTGRDFAIAVESDAAWRPAPLHRFLRVHPVVSPEALADALAPLSPHLAAVGMELGSGPEATQWRAAVESAAPSRTCRLGRMQAPPLSWSHDGQNPVEALVRWMDREG